MNLSIETTVNSTIDKVWNAWTTPSAITKWNFANDEWSCPKAEIDLIEGSGFNYRMEAKDGSMGFDYEGTFTKVSLFKLIEYKLADERRVTITFEEVENGIKIIETFDAEDENSGKQQKDGWQCILNNFKNFVEKE